MNFSEPGWLHGDDSRQNFVITLSAARSLQAAMLQLENLLDELTIDKTSRISSQACHLTLSASAPRAWRLFQSLLQGMTDVDLLLQPQDASAIRLLICDMDMTIVDAETLDEVGQTLGMGDQITPITNAAMRGELDFGEALRQRIGLLAGQPLQLFEEIGRRCRLMPGAQALLAGARAAGIHTILASGGFSPIAEPIARRLGFDEVYCNRLELDNDRLSGRLSGPIVDGAFKSQILRDRSRALGIALQDCCAIGDGANDIPMVQAAGLGIAYHGKPAMRAATSCQINFTDLATARYFIEARSV